MALISPICNGFHARAVKPCNLQTFEHLGNLSGCGLLIYIVAGSPFNLQPVSANTELSILLAFFTMIQNKSSDMKSDNSTKFESMARTTSSSVPEIAPAVSLGAGSVTTATNAIDDAVLRAQGHTAAMPRLFSAMSSLALMFWYDTSLSVRQLV